MASTTYFIYYTPSLALGSHKTTYTREQINKAVVRALGLLKADHQIGDGQFPHAFSKSPIDGTHAHVQGPFFVFPIHPDGSFNGETSAGPDRVVFGSVNKEYTSAVYVAVAAAAGGDGAHDADESKLSVFADTSVNHGRAGAHDLEGHEASEGGAVKPLVPTKEDKQALDLLTDDDVKITLLG
ncbi:guanyl-specific ribonuclease f1 [Ophiostoma piceae UAMH 11346]|uniref:Guanyl-specific ribonuclease f1 n=1 Tax=Ophiostoma piceae (strain UAMH 11346) TaxID=1262450 RepID=S3C2D8_OPHP1|nr:guanyl-specific ribonuclease f1 [Ophiostoma piceae UAMH 11346]